MIGKEEIWDGHVNVFSDGGSAIEASDAVSDDGDKQKSTSPLCLLGRLGFVHAKLLLKAETAASGKCTSGACARVVPRDDDDEENAAAAINSTRIIRPAAESMLSLPFRCVFRRRIVIVPFGSLPHALPQSQPSARPRMCSVFPGFLLFPVFPD